MRVIRIKTNGTYETAEIKKGIASLREEVGGEIEGLTFPGHTDFIMFLNEHGKIIGLDLNPQAMLFCLEFFEAIDMLRGDVVICGLDEEGSSCDLSDEQVDRFMTIMKENPAD